MQVSRDPLRGNLFENLVVSDILKKKLNQDAEGELFFFRTNDGTEVDLLRETSDGLQPIEIKSSTTWSASLSDGLRKFLTLMPSSIRPTIVYGGKSYPSTNSNVSATNFLDFV